MTKRGCYRCQETCSEKGCRICAGKVLCARCNPDSERPWTPMEHRR